jgi:hypothetical protein
MKHDTEMGSVSMIHIPSFIRAGSAIQKSRERNIQIYKQHGDLISMILIFKNEESRIKRKKSEQQRR